MTMTALMRGSDLRSHPVVDMSTGEDIAEVRDVVFDVAAGRITGFTLNKRGGLFSGRLRAVLPTGEVHSVGTDAVMVASSDALISRGDAPDDLTGSSKNDDVIGNIVVTESGRVLGNVRDVVLTGGGQPAVVGFEIDGGNFGAGLVPMDRQRGVSGTALIVPDDYEQRIRADLTGLAAELANLER